jgi:hypothetical protein
MTYTKEQQKENRRKWIEALLSGEFKQGQNTLVRPLPDGEEHCCLGVACELAAREGITVKRGYRFTGYYVDYESHLPPAVQQWLGLADEYGNYDNGEHSLVMHNDLERRTFSEIAFIIESEPEGLCV